MKQPGAENIDVQDLFCGYGRVVALAGASFSIGRGVTVLLGPNGAGKTTLMKSLLGTHRPASGSVTVRGADPSRQRDRVAKSTGWLPQDPSPASNLLARDVVTYAGWLKGMVWPEARHAAVQVLEDVGLGDRQQSKVRSLSGGMKRRVAFAAAVVHAPPVLLLDEPMSGLDPEQRAGLRDLVQEFGKRACVLLSTHILQDLPDLADRVIVLDRGVVRFDDTLQAFIDLADSTDGWTSLEEAYRAVLESDAEVA